MHVRTGCCGECHQRLEHGRQQLQNDSCESSPWLSRYRRLGGPKKLSRSLSASFQPGGGLRQGTDGRCVSIRVSRTLRFERKSERYSRVPRLVFEILKPTGVDPYRISRVRLQLNWENCRLLVLQVTGWSRDLRKLFFVLVCPRPASCCHRRIKRNPDFRYCWIDIRAIAIVIPLPRLIAHDSLKSDRLSMAVAGRTRLNRPSKYATRK